MSLFEFLDPGDGHITLQSLMDAPATTSTVGKYIRPIGIGGFLGLTC